MGELKVDVVLECSGFYTSKEKAQAHINAGARKVVISAPAGNDLPTIVYNTNHKTLKASDTIISAASCTTNCLAPMADALNKYAPIQSGIMVTIHAYTGDQMTLDGPQRKGDFKKIPCSSSQHRSEQHRCCKGNRSCYSGVKRQTDRFCTACTDPDRFYHNLNSSC